MASKSRKTILPTIGMVLGATTVFTGGAAPMFIPKAVGLFGNSTSRILERIPHFAWGHLVAAVQHDHTDRLRRAPRSKEKVRREIRYLGFFESLAAKVEDEVDAEVARFPAHVLGKLDVDAVLEIRAMRELKLDASVDQSTSFHHPSD